MITLLSVVVIVSLLTNTIYQKNQEEQTFTVWPSISAAWAQPVVHQQCRGGGRTSPESHQGLSVRHFKFEVLCFAFFFFLFSSNHNINVFELIPFSVSCQLKWGVKGPVSHCDDGESSLMQRWNKHSQTTSSFI